MSVAVINPVVAAIVTPLLVRKRSFNIGVSGKPVAVAVNEDTGARLAQAFTFVAALVVGYDISILI